MMRLAWIFPSVRTIDKAPYKIQMAVSPEDIATGLELKLLLLTGKVMHYWQHIRQDIYCFTGRWPPDAWCGRKD